ncbi:hypothetical protein GCM10025865_00590 [Paraoerskovia sediminicola]|uniref:Uncharacterized protein n=1 Tax=Paraoerskovia sediminicola TaxID=1138587 RepID=A0ABN6X7J4_9CELL|nr:hypothetical protein [Paraoerskovia sediminicola]BDZ40760.1 hypothetical protein GCM10025865_00590 [Paraoerskovia sediminicola]
MGWWQDVVGRFTGQVPPAPVPERPAPPTGAEIVAAVAQVRARVAHDAPASVIARVDGIASTVDEMVPRLERLGVGSARAHTVVSTATSYLPESVGAYLRLPRDFADTRPIDRGRTALMVLCDQLDLLGYTLDQISDAVSRQDAGALVAHGRFLEEKFGHAPDPAPLPPTPLPPGPDDSTGRLAPPGGGTR